MQHSSCKQESVHKYRSPEGYDLNKPFVINLPIELAEISGVAYYPKDTSVFAINDEYGLIYKVSLKRNINMYRWKFSDAGDYEDLVMIDTIFYALKSNGNIITFTFGDSNSVFKHDSYFPIEGNEFEILYYDSSDARIKMICKDCESDKKKELTGYYFDPVSKAFDNTTFTINIKKIAEMEDKKKIRFKPSAAAIHPVTHELYIISAVNKLLVIADKTGEPKATYEINDRLFKQPEGITFTPSGDMIISNESGEKGTANLLFFSYNKKKRL